MSLVDYLTFAARHRRLLAFGFLLTFASSAGQTFFIGIFGPNIREAFGLDHTGWGTLYLIGTLLSALILPWTGQLIDRLDLRWYVTFALTGLAVACLAISFAHSLVMLVVAIFLLRQMGQGITSHAAATSMARYHGPDRGKALAIASTGIALGEAAPSGARHPVDRCPWLAQHLRPRLGGHPAGSAASGAFVAARPCRPSSAPPQCREGGNHRRSTIVRSISIGGRC